MKLNSVSGKLQLSVNIIVSHCIFSLNVIDLNFDLNKIDERCSLEIDERCSVDIDYRQKVTCE